MEKKPTFEREGSRRNVAVVVALREDGVFIPMNLDEWLWL
ncbi:1048_t:CDS:2 [Funneliformis mosseae]|uniref:1048_t:CDS:1 n=1 Tax=Funneliformis mosseae TaxID=27381 RepID=A0A9N9D9E5_FUNMO|nr:1048_t:CDS:2 [Funneliformis mosseae]